MAQSKNKLLVALPYNHYIEVSPEYFSILYNAKLYKQEWESGYKYYPSEEIIEIKVLPDKELDRNLPEVSIEDILGENYRLTRELEIMKEKYEPTTSDSKELML